MKPSNCLNDETILKKMSNWTNYSAKSIRFRLLFESIIAMLTVKLVSILSLSADEQQYVDFWIYLIYTSGIMLLSESIVFVNHQLDKRYPIPTRLTKRTVIQALINISILLTILFLIQLLMRLHYPDESFRIPLIGLVVGMAISAIFARDVIIVKMIELWRESENKINKIKQEKLILSYNSLQDQLNPHFLFNNISILKSLIYYDKKKALEFTENFSDVYRYVLKSAEKRTVKLADELEFVEKYLALHKARLGSGLTTNINIKSALLALEIAPLSLQLLIENAIKHNIADDDNILIINILTHDKYVEVNNNIQLKESSYSTKTGLNNLIKRYELLTNQPIEVHKDNKIFRVKIPLL